MTYSGQVATFRAICGLRLLFRLLEGLVGSFMGCLLYTSPSPRDS